MVNFDGVEDFGEFLFVFSFVDVMGVGFENVGFVSFLEMKGNVLGKLVIDRYYYIVGVFEFVDIYYMFIV